VELRHITNVAVRLGWSVALAAVISSCLVLAAGAAEADLERVAAAAPATGVALDPRGAADRRELPAARHAPDARGHDMRGEDGAGEGHGRAPGPELPAVENAAGEPLDVSSQACEQNLAIAAKQGLRLPDGWKLYCVGGGLDWNGGSHWGVTCPYEECPEGSGPYVSISNPTYYVVAHELCHANFGNDELMADRCAAKRGASLATSPYS
jgi:hypothetical protein